MKNVLSILILILFAGIYQPANAQATTTAVSVDSVQMSLSMSSADELFLFKNNADFCSSGLTEKDSPDIKNCQAAQCPFVSSPESCSMAITCRKLKNSVMLAQIK